MPQQSSPHAADDDARSDRAVLDLLLNEGGGPWSVSEVVLEIGDHVVTVDSLRRLHGAGLVHRLDDFVFVTRAASRCAALQT
jgi:hypothetical protein